MDTEIKVSVENLGKCERLYTTIYFENKDSKLPQNITDTEI